MLTSIQFLCRNLVDLVELIQRMLSCHKHMSCFVFISYQQIHDLSNNLFIAPVRMVLSIGYKKINTVQSAIHEIVALSSSVIN